VPVRANNNELVVQVRRFPSNVKKHERYAVRFRAFQEGGDVHIGIRSDQRVVGTQSIIDGFVECINALSRLKTSLSRPGLVIFDPQVVDMATTD
jgi:hypothetical protein